MKLLYTLCFMCAFASVASASSAIDEENGTSIVRYARIEELNKRKAMLKQQIIAEDAKRNQSQSGVAPETMEQINERQDSICLDLRSQLVTVELELRELVSGGNVEEVMLQYSNLFQNASQNQENTDPESK